MPTEVEVEESSSPAAEDVDPTSDPANHPDPAAAAANSMKCPIKITARKYKEGYSEEKRPSTCDMTGICITSTNFEFKHAIRSKFNVPGDVNIELYRELAGTELTGNTVEEMGIAPGCAQNISALLGISGWYYGSIPTERGQGTECN